MGKAAVKVPRHEEPFPARVLVRETPVKVSHTRIVRYEQAGTISEFEADDARHLAEKLRGEVEDWVRKNHPEYGV
jgi:hypothetical protein